MEKSESVSVKHIRCSSTDKNIMWQESGVYGEVRSNTGSNEYPSSVREYSTSDSGK